MCVSFTIGILPMPLSLHVRTGDQMVYVLNEQQVNALLTQLMQLKEAGEQLSKLIIAQEMALANAHAALVSVCEMVLEMVGGNEAN